MKTITTFFATLILIIGVKAQCPQYLSIDSSRCSPGTLTVNASVVRTQTCGDSLEIIYDATQGVSGLTGAAKVYMHSGPEFAPFTGWQTAYTKGNWGQDDGVGQMQNIGANLWRIKIHPRTYYSYPVSNCLNAIFMVFRNADGSQVGKDASNQDIVLVMNNGNPGTAFSGVTASYSYSPATYLWSDGSTDSLRTFSSTGQYTVTVTSGGCSASGYVNFRIGGTKINLGPDATRCHPDSIYYINAPTQGYKQWNWFGSTSSYPVYSAEKAGHYWIQATDSANCVSRDTFVLFNAENFYLNIPDTAIPCPGSVLNLDASVSINVSGDSLTIVYDATQGISGLVGAAKVYMHSGPEFTPFAGWNTAYTTGNWGQDDGVGQMTSLGNNRWAITIHPQSYYGYNADFSLNGVFMVFRNADGSATGKDWANNNIFVLNASVQPSSQFTGVTARRKARSNISYNWSNGAVTPNTTVNAAGSYSVTATQAGCVKADTFSITVNNGISVTLGNDTLICPGQHLVLFPGTYNSYDWSNGDTTSTIFYSTGGTVSVTVTDANGCSGTDALNISLGTKSVNLGNDVVRCTPNTVTLLNAGTGFKNYEWNGVASSDSTFSASKPGRYIARCQDSTNCVSYDTVNVINSSVHLLSLPDSSLACAGASVSLNASANITNSGDSIVIIYDATKGTTGLAGAAKVYMHSGAELQPFAGWQYTTGNWGQDDGVGLMTSLGNNIWKITIHPQSYYGYHPDSSLNGIFMVFRNADGSLLGKDDNNNDIYLYTSGGAMSSQFSGITANRKPYGNFTYFWSNSSTLDNISATTSGNYSVSVSDGSCNKSDTSVVVFGAAPVIALGNDTTVCGGNQFVLNAGSGYSNYLWSTGASTATISIAATGNYSVSVTNQFGCVGKDTVSVTALPVPNVTFTKQVVGGTFNVLFNSSATTNADSLSWNFGDGNTSDTTGSFLYPYTQPGTYTVTVIGFNDCGRDTFTQQVVVLPVGIEDFSQQELAVFPNPAQNVLTVTYPIAQDVQLQLINVFGEVVHRLNTTSNVNSISVTDYPDGVYFVRMIQNQKSITKRLNIIH